MARGTSHSSCTSTTEATPQSWDSSWGSSRVPGRPCGDISVTGLGTQTPAQHGDRAEMAVPCPPPLLWGPCTPWERIASSRCFPGDLKGISNPKAEQKGKSVPISPPPLIPCTPWAEMVTAVQGNSKNTRALTVTAAAGPGGPAGGPGLPAPGVPSLPGQPLALSMHTHRLFSTLGTPRVLPLCPGVPAGWCHGAVAVCPPCPAWPGGLAGGTRPSRHGGCGAGRPPASPKPLIHLSQQEMPKLPFHAGSSARGLERSQCRRWQEMCRTS